MEIGNHEARVSEWFIDNSKLEEASDEVGYFDKENRVVNAMVEIMEKNRYCHRTTTPNY
ncbi:hypothetical protein [Ulvibacterium marinum]|uniref:hypothetical protein n=1 Tax=Ulvibacterium marinum TaxID=2419782 RepID=UPI00131440D2|nr:hypothetical protein [Ulvibacterium marinum]